MPCNCSNDKLLTTVIYVQDYPKLSQTYYVLLECLAQDHMSFLATLEPNVFLYILSSISEGLTALGAHLNHFTGTALAPHAHVHESHAPDRAVHHIDLYMYTTHSHQHVKLGSDWKHVSENLMHGFKLSSTGLKTVLMNPCTRL